MQVKEINSRKLYGGTGAGIPLLQIVSQQCEAVISLWGAQLLSFRPLPKSSGHSRDWLWVSPKTEFLAGQPVRGGIPLCIPWFGKHRHDANARSHGFGRNRLWNLVNSALNGSGEVALTFNYASSEADLELFPYRFSLELNMLLGYSLQLDLSVKNLHSQSMPLSFAFHTYFRVPELKSCRVSGLDACNFLDNNKNLQTFQQAGDLSFDAAVDKVYCGLTADNNLQHLSSGEEGVLVSATGSPTAIVWNPGLNQAELMLDIGSAGYKNFVCLERGAAFDDEIQVRPFTQHLAGMRIEGASEKKPVSL